MFDPIIKFSRLYFFYLNKSKGAVFAYLILGLCFIFVGSVLLHNVTIITDEIWRQIITTVIISIGGAIIAISLVTVLVEVCNTLHFHEVLDLYGDYREHGIVRVFKNSEDNEYNNLFNTASNSAKNVKILTLIGGKYHKKKELIDQTFNCAKNSKEFKMLLIEIGTPGYFSQYNIFEPSPEEDASVDGVAKAKFIKNNIEKLKEKILSLNDTNKEFPFSFILWKRCKGCRIFSYICV